MLVRDRMTTNVLTVAPDTSFDQALRLMRERKVRRFPVMSGQRLVGIVSEKDLLNAGPSRATMLDRFELHELINRLTISDVMHRQVITITPEHPLEEAARIMADNKIGGMPVLEGAQLVGIITETDIFRTMTEMLGARRKGLRLTFSVDDHRGVLAELTSEIARQGGHIITMGAFQGDDPTRLIITTKVEQVDEERLTAMLRGKGAHLLDVRIA